MNAGSGKIYKVFAVEIKEFCAIGREEKRPMH